MGRLLGAVERVLASTGALACVAEAEAVGRGDATQPGGELISGQVGHSRRGVTGDGNEGGLERSDGKPGGADKPVFGGESSACLSAAVEPAARGASPAAVERGGSGESGVEDKGSGRVVPVCEQGAGAHIPVKRATSDGPGTREIGGAGARGISSDDSAPGTLAMNTDQRIGVPFSENGCRDTESHDQNCITDLPHTE